MFKFLTTFLRSKIADRNIACNAKTSSMFNYYYCVIVVVIFLLFCFFFFMLL